MKVMKHAIPVLVVVAVGGWAYYANVASGKVAMDMSAHVSSGSAAFPVTLASVERGKIAGSVTYTGSVVPFSEEDIYPRVTGRIVEMPVYPGDAVRAGQVVARLDDVELTSKVREADAMLATSQANRTQMEADVLAAHHGMIQMEKELVMAQADAGYQQSVAARDEQLYRQGRRGPAGGGELPGHGGRGPGQGRGGARQAGAGAGDVRLGQEEAGGGGRHGGPERGGAADGADRPGLCDHRGAERRLRGEAAGIPGRLGATGHTHPEDGAHRPGAPSGERGREGPAPDQGGVARGRDRRRATAIPLSRPA